MPTSALEGRVHLKPGEDSEKWQLRRGDFSFSRKWINSRRVLPGAETLLLIVQRTGQSIDTLLILLYLPEHTLNPAPPTHTHTNKKPHSLRSSIYPLKLSKGSGENTFSGLSTLKTLFPQGSVSKLWLITGCYIMCLCLKGSTVTHRTPAHCRV